jgi:hypothetical protein
MKFVLRRSRLPRHRAHCCRGSPAAFWPPAGPPSHDVAHPQTRSPFLHVLPPPLSRRIDVARDRGPTVDPADQGLRAFRRGGGIGIDAIVLRRTAPLESQSHGARTRLMGLSRIFVSSMGERKFGVCENSRGKPTVIPHHRWDKIRAASRAILSAPLARVGSALTDRSSRFGNSARCTSRFGCCAADEQGRSEGTGRPRHSAFEHRRLAAVVEWAQIKGLRGELGSVNKLKQRVKHDLKYIEK